MYQKTKILRNKLSEFKSIYQNKVRIFVVIKINHQN
jgi:hypothetical protein